MKEYNTKPAAGVQKIETLGGDYALRWDDETRMSAETPPVVSGATEAVATRGWRHGGFIYLLAVNCTQKPQSFSLSLSEPAELVSSEFGAAPRVDNTAIGVDLTPIGYVMMKLKGNNAP